MISIVLADDHRVVREGLRALLSAESNFQIVGEASDGLEAIGLVEKIKPDVLVLDIMMGGANGLEVTRRLAKTHPAPGIVILSSHQDESYVLEALRSGARAYVLKDSALEDLVQAIHSVSAGGRYLSPLLSERAIEAYTQTSEIKTEDPFETLTMREKEALLLAVEGMSNAQIGDRLFISTRTVEVHRAKAMRKLGLRTNSELMDFAIGRGLIIKPTGYNRTADQSGK